MVKSPVVYNQPIQRMMETYQKLMDNTHSIVSMTMSSLEQSSSSTNRSVDNINMASLAEKVMQNKLYVYQMEASSLVVKSADDMLGTFLDVVS